MAFGETPITLIGNLVADPDLRFTSTGQAVASFRIASTPRYFDKTSGQWTDGQTLFMTCNAWRQVAENLADSLTRGMRVIVHGRLKQRSYEMQEGEKRTVYEIEVDDVGPSLRNATCKVNKIVRNQAAHPADAPGTEATTAPAAPPDDQWTTTSSNGGGFSDDPPF